MRVIWFYGTPSAPTIRISPQSALQCPVPNQQHDHEGDLEIAGALTYQEILPLNNDARQRQMQEQALSESDGLTTSEMPACLASTSQRSSMDNYAQFLQEQAAVNQMYAEMRVPQPITPYQSPNVTVISCETKSMVSPDGAYITNYVQS